MGDYFSLDDILYEEAPLLASFREDADGVGYLAAAPAARSAANVGGGEPVSLPLWLARCLLDAQLLGDVKMPPFLGPGAFRDALCVGGISNARGDSCRGGAGARASKGCCV